MHPSKNDRAEPLEAAGPGFVGGRIAGIHLYGRPMALLAPGLAAIVYPLLLAQFHSSVAVTGGVPASPALPAVWLALAFAVPVVGFVFAVWLSDPEAARPTPILPARRLAYLVIAAPTLFTFMGVLTYMAKAPISDPWIWAIAWIAIVTWASLAKPSEPVDRLPGLPRWRVAHGISGAILALFVLFHLANHLFGLVGPEAHLAVMKIGRTIYRSQVIEPLLVATFLFQVVTGLRLAWHWSARPGDGFRVFQIASGGYLSLYILGHMNSVFVFSRTFLHSDTGWGFATGAPTGLIYDPWNIRLVPHYWLGVFLVLGHLVSGLRVVLLAHGMSRALADRMFFAGLAGAFSIATAILLGMCGLRL